MKNHYVLLILFVSLHAWGQGRESCVRQNELYGVDQISASEINECLDLAKYLSTERLRAEDPFKDIQFLAFENSVFIVKPQENIIELLAGAKTKLKSSKAIDYSPLEERFYVLVDGPVYPAVYSYSSTHGGNLGPLRKLIGQELEGALDLRADFLGKRIYVLSREKGWVKAFNIHADPEGRRPENSLNLLGKIELDPLAPLSLDFSESELFILEEGRVLIYPKNFGSNEPSQILDSSGAMIGATQISYDENKKALVVSNQEGPIISFVKDAEGYYAPTP